MGNADTFMSVVDTNNDDSITEQEFYQWSKEYIVCHLPDENVDRMNKLIKIALIGKRGRGSKDLDGASVFDSLDLDGNGSLSLEELAKVLGTDAKDFLDCLDTVHKYGEVDRAEFLRWANSDSGGEFANLDAQLAKIYQEVAAGTLHLFSKYADKVAQSRKSNVPVVNLQ